MTQFENIKKSIRSLMETKKEVWYARYLKYTKEVTIVFLAVAVIIGGLVGYRWYHSNQEKAAQLLFSEGIELYQQAVTGTIQWTQVDLFFNLGYERHKNCALAPFFLAFRAEALAQQKKNDDAIKVLAQAVDQMNPAQPFKTFYQTKLALLQIDSTDTNTQQAGLSGLKTLADDTKNQSRDVAQYFLGLYYWNLNNIEQARVIWQELISSQMAEKHAMSPWAAQAEEKLSQLPSAPANPA